MSFLVIILTYIITCKTKLIFASCEIRNRRPWHLLSETEQLLYAEGYRILRSNGKLDVFSEFYSLEHPNVLSFIEQSSTFYFYHSYLIWEIESQIRNLGGKFSCFSLPYWDFTLDAGLEDMLPSILNDDILGGDGNIKNNMCVTGNAFDIHSYFTPFKSECADEEIQSNDNVCCLKRKKSDSQLLPTVSQIAYTLISNVKYADFQSQTQLWFDYSRTLLVTDEKNAMINGLAFEDPIFPLLLSFMTYLQSLWMDCWDYDKILLKDLQKYQPYAYQPFYNGNGKFEDAIQLDSKLPFFSMEKYSWAYVSSGNILTPRVMYHHLTHWGIKYELGTFWKYSHINDWCEKRVSQWFVQSDEQLLNSFNIQSKSYMQHSIDNIWHTFEHMSISLESDNNHKQQQSMFAMASYLACDFNRKSSLNSCYNEKLFSSIINHNSNYLTNEQCNQYLKNNLQTPYTCINEIHSNLQMFVEYHPLTKLDVCHGKYYYFCDDIFGDGNELIQNFEQKVRNIEKNVEWIHNPYSNSLSSNSKRYLNLELNVNEKHLINARKSISKSSHNMFSLVKSTLNNMADKSSLVTAIGIGCGVICVIFVFYIYVKWFLCERYESGGSRLEQSPEGYISVSVHDEYY